MWKRPTPIVGRTMKMRARVMLLAMSLSAGAWGQYTGEASQSGVRADFVALDRNRDGYISKVEALANPEVHKRFAAFDADRDGRLGSRVRRRHAGQREAHRAGLGHHRPGSRPRCSPSAAFLSPRSRSRPTRGVLLKGFVNAADIVSRAGRITAGVAGARTVHNKHRRAAVGVKLRRFSSRGPMPGPLSRPRPQTCPGAGRAAGRDRTWPTSAPR